MLCAPPLTAATFLMCASVGSVDMTCMCLQSGNQLSKPDRL